MMAAWVVSALVLIGTAVALGYAIRRTPLGVLVDTRGRCSLTQLQLVVWTVAVISLVAAVFIGRLVSGEGGHALGFEVPKELWIVLGISLGSTATATTVKAVKNVTQPASVAASDENDRPRLLQIFLVEEGTYADKVIDIAKFQNFWFTILVLTAYVAQVIAANAKVATDVKIPGFSDSLLVVLGISHAGYVAGKLPNPGGKPSGLSLALKNEGAKPADSGTAQASSPRRTSRGIADEDSSMPSVKLSVTVRQNLTAKYDRAALAQINTAMKAWIVADEARGIRTLHVALDDATAMKKQGVAAVAGDVTAEKCKRAIDALSAKLTPDYLVLFGGPDVVPYFVVPNPSYDPGGDTDSEVPTDNPYACSQAFDPSDIKSYVVPDRVIGRMSDLPEGRDPDLLVRSLETATSWASSPDSEYAVSWETCCDQWREAGEQCVKYIGDAPANLLICPPVVDGTPPSTGRLTARLHLVKCHGAQLDPKFYGQQGTKYPTALSSATLRPLVTPRTVAGAMCCYGAQMFSPDDPAVQPGGPWPIAATYLAGGAYGFLGSTMIAWVGGPAMACADWIVSRWLKSIRGGASIGRACLEAKQEYIAGIQKQGRAPGIEDEKTLLEFVLLGDPSVQPITPPQAQVVAMSAMAPYARPVMASRAAVAERRQRRVLRASAAHQIRAALPRRTRAPKSAKDRSADLFAVVQSLVREDGFRLDPRKARVEKVSTELFPTPALAAGTRRGVKVAHAPARTDLYQYYWSGRREIDGHTQVRLVRVDTDTKGTVLRGSVVESS